MHATGRTLGTLLGTVLLIPSLAFAQARVEKNVVVGMYSGLALVMDVHHPENPNGYGIIHISGSGWGRPLCLQRPPGLSESLERKSGRLVSLGGRVLHWWTVASSRRNRPFSASTSVTDRFTGTAAPSAAVSLPARLSLIQFHRLESG